MSVRLSKTHVDKAIKDVADGSKTYDLIDSQQPGLLLRVGPRGARWAFKIIRQRTTFRLTLGSPPGLTLDEARCIVAEAQRHIANRTDEPGDRFLEDQLIRLGKLPARPERQPRDPRLVAEMMELSGDLPFWTWEKARETYLLEVQRTLREATWKDYRAKLTIAELDALAGRKARRITLEDLAEIVAGVHSSGRETHAVNLASALRPMWAWLWKPHVRKASGVGIDGIGADIAKLCAPPRTPGVKLRPNGKVAGRFVAPPGEIGTVIAVARSGILDPTVSLSLELLTMTAQRRRPIADARIEDFVPWIETAGWGIWSMGPAHRKTADKRDDQRRHTIPLSPALWSRVQAQLLRSAAAGTPYLFPQVRAWKLGDAVDGHMSESALNHRLLDLGLRASPHDLRRGFSTHSQKLLRIARADVKLVMDHSEGIASHDTLEGHYTEDDRLDLKGPVMEKWTAWCEAQTEIAAAALPPLDQLAVEIAARRRAREKAGKAKTAARKKAQAEASVRLATLAVAGAASRGPREHRPGPLAIGNGDVGLDACPG